MPLDQVGVELIAKNRDEYIQALGEAQKRTEALVSSILTTPRATQSMTTGLMATSVALGNFATQAVMGALNSVNQLGKGIEGFIKQSIEAAGRLDQLTRVAYLMGKQQGYAANQVDQMVQSIRRQGIEAVTATQIVTEFARAGFDMAKALELAKVAQDAAQISGENSTQTLERLKWGIMTMQTETLRTAGILVSMDEATRKYAEANKIATGSMTPLQRQQALLNAVLEEGTKIAGAYQMSLDSGYKLWLSLERIINDIMIAIGQPFQEAWYNISRLLYEGGKAVTLMLSEGGKLKPILDGLGATAAVVTSYIQEFTVGILGAGQTLNQFGQIVDKNGKVLADQAPTMLQGILTFVSDSATALTNMADDALVWGFNIIAQLASGIAEGVATVLVTAMDGVSEMLSWFLAPGSPPRVAPKIDLWGALTMTEFLRGFEKADFSVMDQIQGALQQSLGMLVSTGNMDTEGSSQIFQRISEGLIKSMKSGDFSGVLSQIKSDLGAYGQEVSLLIEKQLKLKAATEALTKSQEDYKKAIEAAREADSEMNKLMDEYNALASGGASKEILKKKKEEFDLAKKRRDEAIKTAKTEEKNITDQQKNVEGLSKEADLQQQLIKQVYELTKAKLEEAKAAEAAAKAAELAAKKAATAGGGAGKAGLATPAKKDIVQETGFLKNKMDETAGSIKKTFDELKNSIRTQLENIFAPIMERWKTDIMPNIEEIKQSFNRLSETVDALNEKFKISDGISKFLPPNFVETIGFAIGALAVLGISAGAISAIIGAFGAAVSSTMFIVIAGITALKLAWDSDFGNIRSTTEQAWGIIVNWFEIGSQFLGAILPDNLSVSTQSWENLWGVLVSFGQFMADLIMRILFPLPYYIVSANKALEDMVGWVEKVAPAIGTWLVKAVEDVNKALSNLALWFKSLTLPSWLTPGSPTPLEIALIGLAKILDIVVALFPKFKLPDFVMDGKTMLTSVKKSFEDVFDEIKKFGDKSAEAWRIGVDKLVTHSITMFAALLVAFQTGDTAIIETTRSGLVELLEVWKQFWLNLVTYIYNEAIPAVVRAVEELIRRAKQAMLDAIANGGFDEIGNSMVQMIISGLVNSTQTLIDSLTQMLSQVATSAESSSHQYFYDLGYNMVMAMIDGLWAAYPLYVAALNEFQKQQPSGGGGGGGSKANEGTQELTPIASGGPVFAGQRYLAGESAFSRPETFIAAQSGYMLTRQDAISALAQAINTPVFRSQTRSGTGTEATASKLRLAGAGMMGGGSQSVQNYNLTLNSKMEPQTVNQGFQVFKLLGSI